MNEVTDLHENAALRVNAAQRDIDAALENGDDTQGARATLEAAQVEATRLDAESVEISASQLPDPSDAEALVEEAATELVREFAELGGVQQKVIELPLNVAAELLKARAEAADEADASTVLAERATALKARLDGLRARRAAIVERRAGGALEDYDGPDLALLDADIEGVIGLLDRLKTETSTQSPCLAAAKLQNATKQWEIAVQESRTEVLGELAAVFDERLALIARALRESTQNFSRQWTPSPALNKELARLGR